MPKYYYMTVTFCCACGEGPYSSVQVVCSGCGHSFCSYCRTETVKVGTDFTRRKPAHTYLQENKAYFRGRYELSGGTDKFIRTAMEDARIPQRSLFRTDYVESFCGEADLNTLEGECSGDLSRAVALIDDRKEDIIEKLSRNGICRVRKGPLTVQQLHNELNRPRYRSSDIVFPAAGTADPPSDSDEANAERRLIYITDLTPTCVIALLDTASPNQAHFLRDCLYSHLAFTSSLNVFVSSTRFKKFAMEFHLPYYAWRKGPPCVKDERMVDGRCLRRVQHLSFLDETPSDTRSTITDDYIYEAQISCLVAGLDDSSWIAYAFVDTCHNGKQNDDEENEVVGNEESVEYYHNMSLIPGNTNMDPMGGGVFRADPPIWCPRTYFLQVLEARLEQVKHEWVNVVSMMQRKTCPYIQDYQVSKDVYLSPDTENRGERLKRFHDWTGSTIRLLLELIHVLSETVRTWDRFQSRDAEYFLDDNAARETSSSAPPPSLCLLSIAKHVDEMRDQLKVLEYQEKVCNNISRELESYLALEDRKSTLIQLRTNDNVKAITIIALLITPPGVAATIFSMEEGVLPWKPSLTGWLITTVILYVVVGLVLKFVLNWSLARTDKVLQGQRPMKRAGRRLRNDFSIPNLNGGRGETSSDEVALIDLESQARPASSV